jgi:hypothetical protein
MDDNHDQLSPQAGHIIHYCYGNHLWDKRTYFNSGSPLHPNTPFAQNGGTGTILGELEKQLCDARIFFETPIDQIK